MKPDELIEAAARAIWFARHPKSPAVNWDDYLAWYKEGKADPKSSVHYSTIAGAMREARAAASVIIEACAAEAENGVSAECCENPIEGGDPEVGSRPECCGSPTLVLRYPNGIAAAIRALAPVKEG